MVRPEIAVLKEELKREKHRQKYRSTLRNTLLALVVFAAIAVLAAMLFFPVLRIVGDSMSPTLRAGEIVIAVKGSRFEPGDIVGFYYGNKLLVKRFIAGPGDWVTIMEDGTVYVNQAEVLEPYLSEKAYGDCDIAFPYQVPEGRYFVLGDHRSVSVDSRNTTVGCIAEEQMMGKIVFCVWPLADFGRVKEVFE